MKGFSSVPLKFESFVELNQVENCKQKPMPCRALPELRIRLDTNPPRSPNLTVNWFLQRRRLWQNLTVATLSLEFHCQQQAFIEV